MWFQYVVKLNDRNLSRKRAYGITFWGTLGFFGIMLYRILDKIPLIIKSSYNYYILTLSITTLLNLTEVFICLLIGLIILMNTTYTIRLQSKLSRFSNPIYGILATILHLLVFILNFRIFFIFNKISIPIWPYIIMFLYKYIRGSSSPDRSACPCWAVSGRTLRFSPPRRPTGPVISRSAAIFTASAPLTASSWPPSA